MSAVLVTWIAVGPAIAGLVAHRRGRRSDRVVSAGLAVSSIAATILLVGAGLADDATWARLGPEWIELRVDRVAALLLVAFTTLGTIVSVYAGRAFDDGAAGRFHERLAWLVGGAALVAVPGGPLPLVAGWLISSRALAGLVDGWVDSATAKVAVTRLRRSMLIADIALLLGVALAVGVAGAAVTSGSPNAIADLRSSSVVGVDADLLVATLIMVAGAVRSTLVPFHRWLTATLYAPTPVSAIVHAGFVAGAGLLMLRFATVVTDVEVVLWAVGLAALATLGLGIVASLARADAKGALAWSTVGQMAFMVLQCVVGGFAAAVVHIVGHGMYKASQFLGVGETVAAGLRSRRRPQPGRPVPAAAAWIVAGVVAIAAVALGAAVGPDDLGDAEQVLLYGTLGLTLAGAIRGILAAQTHRAPIALSIAVLGAPAAAVTYFGVLGVVKGFLDPSIPSVEAPSSVAMPIAIAALGVIVALVLITTVPALASVRASVRWWSDVATRVAPPMVPTDAPLLAGGPARRPHVAAGEPDDATRAALRAHINRAAEIVAPAWPLSSFVAVNPLGGLEALDFDDAAIEAEVLRGRAFRSLAEFRTDHQHGVTTDADLAWAAAEVVPIAGTDLRPALGSISTLDIVLADLLHGPEAAVRPVPRTELERRAGVGAGEATGIDELVSSWVLDHMAPPMWALEGDGAFWPTARRQLLRHAHHTMGRPAIDFAEALTDDPVDAVEAALRANGIAPDARVAELRGLLASVRGCVGLARWRTDWADAAEATPMIRVAEIAAARAVLDALLVMEIEYRHGRGTAPEMVDLQDDVTVVSARVAAVLEALGESAGTGLESAIGEVLGDITDTQRRSIWQRAQERRFDQDTLGLLDHVDPGVGASRPASQVVFCIDVRSEGLRRNLEAAGEDETIGFAGFFGIPMAVQEVGWTHDEARCPVLVAPTTVATEIADPGDRGVRRRLGRRAALAATAASHKGTKHLPGAPFVAAEATGLFSAVRAAQRTLSPSSPRPAAASETIVRFDPNVGLDQRVFWAESVLQTMGLTDRFARLVVLCGHTSHTVNNAHGTSLECGACGGAGGAMNARAVATLLNDTDVRSGLAGRGIEIPDDTWFTGAIHETTADRVELLDLHLLPAEHRADVAALTERLGAAGRRQSTVRAAALPGDEGRVRDRGGDWAQPRPEWGLATNAAFIIAPRSATAGLDLDGRAFLHSYDAVEDPDGSVLEAIMTAPLVVGHWISSQYYFSSVDPDVFGAGDKLLHNPVGSLGVITGAAGDLRVGLPLQSTHVDGAAHHQPLRLLAMVQADLATIDTIIARNPVLGRLVEGSWLRIAARSGPDAPWSQRSRHGDWSTEPRVVHPEPVVQTR